MQIMGKAGAQHLKSQSTQALCIRSVTGIWDHIIITIVYLMSYKNRKVTIILQNNYLHKIQMKFGAF
jgi:hypothetical protein